MSDGGASPHGVLGADYARDRVEKPEVAFRYRVRARIVADALARFLPDRRELSVLDLGCAEGRTLVELSALLPETARLQGVEYAAELLDLAGDLPPNVTLVQGDAAALPESVAGPFDCVSALAVLEHLPSPLDAVREAAGVLRPGGLFVATCPNPFWDHVAGKLGLLDEDQHETELDRPGMTALARDAGLELLAFERFMWAPVGLLPYLRMPVSPDTALRIDRAVGKLRLLDFGFVNQALIAGMPTP